MITGESAVQCCRFSITTLCFAHPHYKVQEKGRNKLLFCGLCLSHTCGVTKSFEARSRATKKFQAGAEQQEIFGAPEIAPGVTS